MRDLERWQTDNTKNSRMMFTQVKIIVVSVIAAVTLIGTQSLAQTQKQTDGKKTDAVAAFYEHLGSQVFWYDARNARSAKLRDSVLRYVSNANYLGMDASRYHFPKDDVSGLTMEAMAETDRRFTVELIRFARDLYEGGDVATMIGNDEISGKYRQRTDSFLLTWLAGITDCNGLSNYMSLLQPGDSTYIRLVSELSVQMGKGDAAKVKSLQGALAFWRWIGHFGFGQYIVVNIPAARLFARNGSREPLSMKMVVGKPSTRTPRMTTWCDKIILYPYWNVPTDIARKELLPAFKKSRGNVAAMNMQILDKSGRPVDPYSLNWASFNRGYFPYTVRQCTGCDNALGVIKFDLTDPFSVYMHDTNNKKAFKSNSRFLSHGCMRLERPIDLGNYLLDNKLDSNFLLACFKDQKPITTKLKQPVPVFVIYATAGVNNGSVEYYKDIYKLMKYSQKLQPNRF